MKLALDMYQTAAVAVAVLFLGSFLRKRVRFLETFCIPAPVVGGVIFATLTCILYVTGVAEFAFDETLKNVCMVIFFTSVGTTMGKTLLRAWNCRRILKPSTIGGLHTGMVMW
jgi:ESS family glutamate:Na+ symporter